MGKKIIFAPIYFSLAVVVLGLSFSHPALATGAIIYLSPSSGSYNVNSTFSVTVFVDTDGAQINAVEGFLKFSQNKLQVVNISKDGSIFTLWAVEPSFSNSAGTIKFGGGIPAGHYSGSAGKVLTITFKALAQGQADINSTGTKILAADGLGTDIFSGSRGASYAIVAPPPPPPPTEEIPPEPIVPEEVEKPEIEKPEIEKPEIEKPLPPPVLPAPFFSIGPLQVSYPAAFAALIALIVILFILLGCLRYRQRQKYKHIKKEVGEAKNALHKAVDLFKDDIREQIEMLEKTRTKRQLTEEEDKIIKQLKRDLEDVEKFVRKEIEDIEKEGN